MSNVHHRFAFASVAVAFVLALFALYWFGVLGARVNTETVLSDESASEQEVIVADESNNKTTLFGTMLAFNTNEGLRGLSNGPEMLMSGWSTILADKNSLARFLLELTRALEENAVLTAETGFSSNRDVVGAFVWNVIEPTKGEYDWSITDATLEAAGKADVTLSAVIQPFASWDQTVDPEVYKDTCQAIDFGYFDFMASPVSDWDSYENFLTATVERYDGDGVNDMPSLKTRVASWEIGNEYDGSCGGYFENPEGYAELLRRSYQVIKQADPQALVLNAGALEIVGFGNGPNETRAFWQDFFDAGADAYLDAFNLHYNRERNGADDSPDAWIEHLVFFNDLMDGSDGRKPMWVTEFGTYSGTPNSSSPPGQPVSSGRTLPTQSAEFQSAWFFRYAVIGFSQGVERIFIDLEGSENNGIGASSLFNQGGRGKDGVPRAFMATLQEMGVTLDGFSAVEELGEGQYVFSVNGKNVYALWEGSTPKDLSGSIHEVGIDGKEKIVDASTLRFSSSAPILAW